jgi:uncharacterized membrane protein
MLDLQVSPIRDLITMTSGNLQSRLGLWFFGLAAIILGIVGFGFGDFATNWQRVQPGAPLREVLAYLAAACELLSGLAIFWRRTAQAGAFFLTILYSVFALLWVIRIFISPQVYDNWGNFFEELSLVVGGTVAITSLAPPKSRLASKTALITRIYGICAISFGAEHFIYFAGAASWVPAWIPPGQRFWVAATGTFFLMAATAILSGVLASLAARLLTIMIFGFEILVWAPKLLAAPHDHFNWAGNAICFAMAAAAWVVADAISQSEKIVRAPETVHRASAIAWPAVERSLRASEDTPVQLKFILKNDLRKQS